MELERKERLLHFIQKCHPADAPADVDALQEWLADPERAAIMRDVDAMLACTEHYHPGVLEIDEASAYQAIRQKAGLAKHYTRPVLGGILLKAAAAMLLLVGVTLLIHRTLDRGRHIGYAAGDAVRRIDLPDGSRVWLRPNARLAAPERFDNSTRSVFLEGGAYFEVMGNPTLPFRVEGPSGAHVEVLGTAFGVESDVDIQVVVREGSVRLNPPDGTAGQVLHSGDLGRYEGKNRRIAISRRGSSNALSWHTGGLEFVGTPLKTVLQDVESHYGVRVLLNNPAVLGCPYTAPLTRQPAEEVLEALAYAFKMQLSTQPDGTFVLEGGKCR